MPGIQGRTREQIRVSVGLNCKAVKLITASATGSATTFLTQGLWGGTNDNLGWLQFTGPTSNDGSTARVRSSTVSGAVFTLTMSNILAAALTATAAGDTAELWDMKFDPAIVHEAINQAIIEATGLAYDPEESLALHGDGRQKRFDIPSEFVMVNGLYRRVSVESTIIHDATSAWDEIAAPANVTRSVDTQDYKKAGGANRFVIAGAFTTGNIASKAISSLDLSGYDYIEFWVKSSIATTAGDFRLLLDNTAAIASPLELLDVPALVANTWAYVRVALVAPSLDTAIISVGVDAQNNIAANTLWINDVKAVKNSTAQWVEIDRHNWHIDQEERDIVCLFAPPYQLLKLTGGDKPVLLTTDAGVCEIDDQFVIARATQLTLLACGGGPGTDPDALRQQAAFWKDIADRAYRSLPIQYGNRVVG